MDTIPDKPWMKTHKPDVIVAVYNDHATAFESCDDPDLRDHDRAGIQSRGRRLQRRQVRQSSGDPELASHIASEVIPAGFRPDLLVNEIDVDHGLTVPLSCVFGEVKE